MAIEEVFESNENLSPKVSCLPFLKEQYVKYNDLPEIPEAYIELKPILLAIIEEGYDSGIDTQLQLHPKTLQTLPIYFGVLDLYLSQTLTKTEIDALYKLKSNSGVNRNLWMAIALLVKGRPDLESLTTNLNLPQIKIYQKGHWRRQISDNMKKYHTNRKVEREEWAMAGFTNTQDAWERIENGSVGLLRVTKGKDKKNRTNRGDFSKEYKS